MEYLPREIPNAKVLITVRTYPLPNTSHGEIVCTAGLLEDGKWIRIYPIRYRTQQNISLKKYSWININLTKIITDKRPETYRPKIDIEQNFKILEWIDTSNNWSKRKFFVLKELFYSFDQLIGLARGKQLKSLATIKPKEIIDFEIEKTDREWKQSWQSLWGQLDCFDNVKAESLIRKIPFKFYYKFITEDRKIRRLEIEDWEIGELYWKCFEKTNNEEDALKLIKQKYYNEFVENKDLYFFVGTNYTWHMKNAHNPFMIIGLFYPPKTKENPQLKFDL